MGFHRESVGVIDFVLDCGADPTGVLDVGPAFTTAMNKLQALATDPVQPLTTLSLYVPPGLYQFSNVATVGRTFNFTGKGSTLRIFGDGDASIFYINLQSAGALVASIANMNTMEIDHLAFIGSAPIAGAAPATPDCGDMFLLSPLWRTHIHHVSVSGLVSQGSVFISGSPNLEVDNFLCVASKAATGASEAIIQANGQLGNVSVVHVHDSTWLDLGRVNGAPVPGGTIDGIAWLSVVGPVASVIIESCFFRRARAPGHSPERNWRRQQHLLSCHTRDHVQRFCSAWRCRIDCSEGSRRACRRRFRLSDRSAQSVRRASVGRDSSTAFDCCGSGRNRGRAGRDCGRGLHDRRD